MKKEIVRNSSYYSIFFWYRLYKPFFTVNSCLW